ncbi:hypothetical protein SBRCBS47491_007643 [Sporothrix bragantina]|uniref:PCI domain-containing protein n=1 Tax=Sporothrix bragantina TaxID=671064 RepID=A0ABP0CG65_9PEZI
MAQLKAMDALEPFLALAKSANSPRQAADLVVRATSHPSTYVFAELLQCPQIQALARAEPEYAVYLTVLQIFSYGTYADYERGTAPTTASSHSRHSSQSQSQSQTAPSSTASASPLPTLTDAQATKLRQLSLISLATDRSSLGYDHLVKGLRLADASQLETLVMAAVYAGLVTGTLDPAHQVVRIGSVAPVRDPVPGAIPRLHAALHNWSQRCETTLAELDEQIAGIRRAAAARAKEAQKWDAQFKRVLEADKQTILNKERGSSGGGGGVGKRAMTLNMNMPSMDNPSLTSMANPRFNKRGSNMIASSGGPSGSHAVASGPAHIDDDEGAMDLDDDDATDANKRNRNA